MGWTLRQHVEEAYSEIGLASYVFDLQPEQMQSAAKKLIGMMGMWSSKGVKVGFPISTTPGNIDLDTEWNCPNAAIEAINKNLGLRVAGPIGKVVSPDLKAQAKYAYDELLNYTSKPIEMQLPGRTPRGAGNKPWRNTEDPFVEKPNLDPLQIGSDGNLSFRGR